jgi:hypothetical protein
MMGACAHLFIVFAKPGIFVNTFTVKSKRNDNSVEHIHTSNVHVRSKKKKHETEEKPLEKRREAPHMVEGQNSKLTSPVTS